MSVTKHRLRKAAAVALVGAVALGTAAACGGDNEPAPGEKPTTLVVDTFGEFGYDELVKQYEQTSGIKIELRKTAQLGEYRPKLVRYLATNKGAGDVVALEEGIINEFKINPSNWVDLSQYVGDKSADYLPWKYQLGKTLDGKLIGLPTDVGSLAVCYRRDLFEAAGMPTDREEVAKLWPDWNGFIAAGQTYRSKTGKALLDSVTTAASAIIFQVGGDSFYDANNELFPAGADTSKLENLVAANSPAVKTAWDTAIKMVDANITAKVRTWSPEWSGGFKNGTFAATFCPSWMTGIVEGNSGAENAGKWDVAAVPGGGGNWGGSWLSVPTQSKWPAEAAKLAEFLTNAQSQVAAFKLKGPLPTNLTALQNPDFQAYQNAYFNNAPTGKIFGGSVQGIKPLTLGPKHGAVKERALEPALQSYEGGTASAADAWANFLKEVPTQGAY
jgi:cellobiose transport system substrate-binding protein